MKDIKPQKHSRLNPKLWDTEKMTLLPDVKEKIEEIVDTFLSQLKEDKIKIIPEDVILIGSNAGYNYNSTSDLDIHIVADVSDLYCPDDLYPLLYSAYKSIFNSKYDISLHGVPAEIYVETEGMPRISDGVYSVTKDKWLKRPEPKDVPEIDEEKFDAEFSKWQEKVDDILDKGEDLKNEDQVVDLINDIYKLRQNGLKTDAGMYSIPNLVFKEIRSLGELDELKDLKDRLVAKRLSLESLQKDRIIEELTSDNFDVYKELDNLENEPKAFIAYHGSLSSFSAFKSSPTLTWFTTNEDYAADFALGKYLVYTVELTPDNILDLNRTIPNTDGNIFKADPEKEISLTDDFVKLAKVLNMDQEELARTIYQKECSEGFLAWNEIKLFTFIRSILFKDILVGLGYDCVETTEEGHICYGMADSDKIRILSKKSALLLNPRSKMRKAR